MSSQREATRQLVTNNPRKSGALLLFIGAFGLYNGAMKPLQDASEGVHTVTISDKMIILGLVGMILGLALLIGGGRITRFTHPAPGESRVVSFIVVFVMVGIGAVAYYFLKTHIESMGYVFH